MNCIVPPNRPTPNFAAAARLQTNIETVGVLRRTCVVRLRAMPVNAGSEALIDCPRSAQTG